MAEVRPYTIAIAEERLDDLARRLAQVRMPVAPAAGPWQFGTDPDYLAQVIARWRSGYDWRTWENRLNALGSSMASVEGLDVHFLLVPGAGSAPFPLLLTHGWPGSIAEFIEIADMLAHPEEHGGDAEDGFTLVIPSIPGFGFSQAPASPLTPRDVGRMFSALMGQLGFTRYGAHGGDIGGCVTGWMGHDDPAIAAIHMNMQVLFPDPADLVAHPPGEAEAKWLSRSAESMFRERGYATIQGTRPQTLAYALDDSPAGLAAWILEKFKVWTNLADPAAPPPFDFDALITNVMLYWLGQGAAPPSWYYIALHERRGFWMEPGGKVQVPTGFCFFPGDIMSTRPPREHSARVFANIVHRREYPGGGHFPALECPAVLAEDIRTFFRPWR